MFRKVLILLLFSFSTAIAGQMHCFIVCDTHAEKIGPSIEENYHNMRSALHCAAKATQLSLREYLYTGESATSQFLEEIKQLEVGREDVIVFYWAGHGYRTLEKETPWPSFSFAHEWRGVDLSFVAESLIEKRPRLLLCIADTCNQFLATPSSPPMAHGRIPSPSIPEEVTRENYKALFLDSEGAYLASSSIPGQYSWYHLKGGGFFTNAFLEALSREVQNWERAEWLVIFQRAAQDDSYRELPEIQTPQYQHITFRK